MSVSDKPHNLFTIADLIETQKTFFKAWSNANLFACTDKKQTRVWPQWMDLWNQSTGSVLPNDIQRVYSSLIGQAHIYNFIGDQLSTFMENYNNLNKTSKNWQQELEKYFNELKSGFVTRDMASFVQKILELPMDNIHRTFSSASLMPGDFLQGLKNDVLHTAAEKYLSVPCIGYTRESQEQHLQGIRLWANYQSALNDFNNANSRIGIQALEQLQEKMIELGKEGKNITGLRQIYDLWVDASERAYAEFVCGKEYSRLYGALVNSLMEYKRHNQQIINELLAAMNVPTQKGMNTVKKRQQELRRELYSVRQQLKQGNERIGELSRQLELLQNKVKSMDSSPNRRNKTLEAKKAMVINGITFEDNTKIVFSANEKRPGSAAFRRYERYKKCKTFGELAKVNKGKFLRLDASYDLGKGFLKVVKQTSIKKTSAKKITVKKQRKNTATGS